MTATVSPRPPLPAPPRSKATLRVRRDVLLDRAAFSLSTSRVEPPEAQVLERVALEVAAAHPLFTERGWIDDPASYHREPPAPEGIRRARKRSGRLTYTQLTWEDGFEPDPAEPGYARFMAYRENRLARVAVLRHRGKRRPWVVLVHGWGMGTPGLDLRALRASSLHEDIGVNVASVVLPLHGKRKPAGAGMAPMPGVDVMDNVHGLAQAVWDIRQLVTYLRSYDDTPIGMVGLSLGGYTTALTTSVDDRFACAIPLVPAVDLVALMEHGAEMTGEDSSGTLIADPRVGDVMRPVAPLHLEPKVPHDRRLIVAGTVDQFVDASTQGTSLWAHWDQPEICWFHGSHVGMFWNRQAQQALHSALHRYGFGKPTAA